VESALQRIRILLAEMPPLLRDVFRQVITDQPDMEVVGELTGAVGLLMAAGQNHADVVILGLRDPELPGIGTHLLSEYPHLKILGVTVDGRQAFLHELLPHRLPLGEASPAGLLDAIRTAIRTRAL
jgi:DNA-binding NarL/FixJ family response regulator